MEIFDLSSGESGFSDDLNALVKAVHDGSSIPYRPHWGNALYYEYLIEKWPDMPIRICVHEGYFRDWLFCDEELLEYIEIKPDEITSAHRVQHGRDSLKRFVENNSLEEAPCMLFVRLTASSGQSISLILGLLPAGQAGMDLTIEEAFLGDDFEQKLIDSGWLDLDALEQVSDQWILENWSVAS